MCLLQSANCHFANFPKLEKGLVATILVFSRNTIEDETCPITLNDMIFKHTCCKIPI